VEIGAALFWVEKAAPSTTAGRQEKLTFGIAGPLKERAITKQFYRLASVPPFRSMSLFLAAGVVASPALRTCYCG
jgi:hypothetical protein